ncbi:RNA polymerase factor sigma-54 [Megasphaera butyrica]|uniref:RNA polymerase factor sigma-54 n=1 Tax=Megasphaera butyrica TaxID=2981791 RepID=UPI0008233BF9|nr:RNA polymerase factor sigma-54 [Megasphaera butyrica]MCU6713764.1 RNA polymerase factor sigma-54 [Megasphaera butyrica]SCH17386.1 RNA polymerase factor sigma-54 [uncultured Megasphaera sp.]SCI88089.1 RNA polymerase factor sigma-54 [uncultured Ruminococcus sp.]
MAKIALTLEQKIKLSQMQRLTIQMMTLRGQDLVEFLYEKVTENPLLDIRYPDVRPRSGGGMEKPIDNIRSGGDSLEEKLMKELRVQSVSKKVMLAAGLVIQSLDEKGFFAAALEDIGVDYGLSVADMEAGLRLVQTFDPPGVGARTIQEALLIQTRRRKDAPAGAEELLMNHYDDFIRGHWKRLEERMGLSPEGLGRIRRFLKKLALQPAAPADERTEFVRADIEILCDEEGHLTVRSLEDLPDVFFRDDLYTAYGKDGDKATQDFIRKAKRQFLDLQTALAYRRQSIFTVVEHIVKEQGEHFLHGGSLRPLTQKDIAAATGLSAATVSRVCRDRYALFRGRIYPIQSFLAHHYRCDRERDGSISDKAIMEKMARLIAEEDCRRPWSDQDLADYFSQQSVHVARRTITKFRFKMNIPNSRMRRRMKA